MTIASEITRLQTAKTNIKTSIENKWVTVPDTAKYSNFSTYIDQIEQWWDLWATPSLEVVNAYYSKYNSGIQQWLWDIINSNGDFYYNYFWFYTYTSSPNPYKNLAVFYKESNKNPSFVYNQACYDNYGSGIVGFRMKRSGTDVKVSVLWYQNLSSYSSDSRREYKYLNATNATFDNVVSLWEVPDATYQGWKINEWIAACGISDDEAVSSINKTSLSFYSSDTSNYKNLKATFNQ